MESDLASCRTEQGAAAPDSGEEELPLLVTDADGQTLRALALTAVDSRMKVRTLVVTANSA
jgi:hypothetical protein